MILYVISDYYNTLTSGVSTQTSITTVILYIDVLCLDLSVITSSSSDTCHRHFTEKKLPRQGHAYMYHKADRLHCHGYTIENGRN